MQLCQLWNFSASSTLSKLQLQWFLISFHGLKRLVEDKNPSYNLTLCSAHRETHNLALCLWEAHCDRYSQNKFCLPPHFLPLSLPIYVRRMGLGTDSRNNPNTYKKSFFPLKNNNKRERWPHTQRLHIQPLLWLKPLHSTKEEKLLNIFGACKERKHSAAHLSFSHTFVGFFSSSWSHTL